MISLSYRITSRLSSLERVDMGTLGEENLETLEPLDPHSLTPSHKIEIIKVLIKGAQLEVLSKRFVTKEVKKLLDDI